MRNADRAGNCDACGQPCAEDYYGPVSLKHLDDAVQAATVQIAKYHHKEICQLQWGYGGCSHLEREELKELSSYLPVIERYTYSIKKGSTPCVCPEQIRKVMERVNILSDTSVCNSDKYTVKRTDYSHFEDYLKTNPKHVPYEPWERAMRIRMPNFKVNVELQRCLRLTYQIKIKLGERFEPKILYELSVARKKVCGIDYKISVDFQECKIQYNKLVEKNPDCKIGYDTFVELKKCGVSYEVVSKLDECGISVDYKSELKDFEIETSSGEVHTLTDLSEIDKVLNSL